jgi:hypothetical protein
MSDTESVTPMISIDEFKNTVREWLMLEESMSEMQKVIREKRKRLQKLSEYISVFMKQNNKEMCDVGNEQMLILKKRKSTGGLKKEYIMKVLSEIVSQEQAKNYMDKMYSMRPIKETDVIKRTNV